MSAARDQMISQQIRTCEVLTPRVLEAMRRVPRERFVPAAWRSLSYADSDIPLPHGKRMLTPVIVGRILQALAPLPGEFALEVGTGSGYLSACLRAMGAEVRSLELHADLARQAQANLAAAAVSGVVVETADGTALGDDSRYDCIVLTASLPVWDERFARALKPGGRLFLVQGTGAVMEAILVQRTDTGPARRTLFETSLAPLENARLPPGFCF